MKAIVHKQVFAQVKVLVDTGLKDVIETLNKIPNVWTFESCEGGIDQTSDIWLCCGFPNSNNDKATFEFARRLYVMLIKAGCNIGVSLEWHCGATISPHILLCFPKVQSKSVVSALKDALVSDAFAHHSSNENRSYK